MQTVVFIEGWKIIVEGERIDGVTVEKMAEDNAAVWPYTVPNVTYTHKGNFKTWTFNHTNIEPPDDFQGALV